MNRIILLIVWMLIIFTGCQQNTQTEDNNIKTEEKEMVNDNNEKKQKEEILKSGMKNLLQEKSPDLELQYNGGRFLKATEYFTNRLLSLLSRDLETEWRDKNMDNYQVALKFQGYKEIHVNTEYDSFWFQGEDKIYHAKGLKVLWNRYIIRLVNDEPMYDGFEKTVFSKRDFDLDDDGKEDHIQLFYDGDVRLRINDQEQILDKHPSPFLEAGQMRYYHHRPLEVVNLEYMDPLGLFMYTVEGFDRIEPYTEVYFYRYKNKQIHQIWSSKDDVNCEVQNIDLVKGLVDIEFPFAKKTYEVKLNDKEQQVIQKVIEDHKELGVEVYDDYMDNIKGNIMCRGGHIAFEDYDGDGEQELILVKRIEEVGGAIPLLPFTLRDRVRFIFELTSDEVRCVDILFERDWKATDQPFEFPRQYKKR